MPSHLRFDEHLPVKGTVTKRWTVCSTAVQEIKLGFIGWRTGWRRYVFEPYENTVFDASCLGEILVFLNDQTAAQRLDTANRKAIDHG